MRWGRARAHQLVRSIFFLLTGMPSHLPTGRRRCGHLRSRGGGFSKTQRDEGEGSRDNGHKVALGSREAW